MFMSDKNNPEFVRTTIWLPRSLHEQSKIMAILTRTSLSNLMRVALSEKMKELNETIKK